jgi:hypothetical protein
VSSGCTYHILMDVSPAICMIPKSVVCCCGGFFTRLGVMLPISNSDLARYTFILSSEIYLLSVKLEYYYDFLEFGNGELILFML